MLLNEKVIVTWLRRFCESSIVGTVALGEQPVDWRLSPVWMHITYTSSGILQENPWLVENQKDFWTGKVEFCGNISADVCGSPDLASRRGGNRWSPNGYCE